MDSKSNGDTYWANLPAADFAREALSKFVGLGGSQGDVLLRSHRAYDGALPTVSGYGTQASSSSLGSAGSQGQETTIKINQQRVNVNAKLALVTQPALTWVATAATTDSGSLAAADRGSAILENLWKNGPYQGQAISTCLASLVYGESFVLSLWDTKAGEKVDFENGSIRYSGDLKTYIVPSWDSFRDPSAKSYEESPWRAARVLQNKWDLVARYPDHKDAILKASSTASAAPLLSDFAAPGLTGGDSVPVFYVFHQLSPAVPLGLQSIFLNPETILEHAALEKCYQSPLPLHRLAAGDILNTPWAYSDAWDTLAVQDLRDEVESALATNITTFGRNVISAESDANLPPEQVADGPLILKRKPGSPPPMVLNFAAQPPTAFQHSNALRAAGREGLGLNDVSMGQPESAQMNAQAFALLQTAAISQSSDLQRRFVKFVSDFGRSMLKIFRQNASEPRKLAMTGVHGPQSSQSWSGEDFEDLDDVYVTIGSPLTQSPAGRLQLAQMFIAQGFVQSPEQLQEVVESGNLKPLTQGLQAELLYVAEENEQLLKGESPPVKITDSHQLHIREHRATTFSAQARANADVNIASDKHIKEHLDMLLNTDPRILAIMGQAQPPPGAPPAPVQAGADKALASPLGPDEKPIPPPTNPASGEQGFPLAPPSGQASK